MMRDSGAAALVSVGVSPWALVLHVAPALSIVLGALGLVVAFAVRGVLRGRYWEEQIAGRGSDGPDWDVAAAALRLGHAAHHQWLLLGRAPGGVLFVASGICDFLDGRVARHQGTAGPRGALLDSVIDRGVEAVVFAGLGWYFRNTWVLAVVLAAMVGSSLVPYVRARAEALGVAFSNIGIAQRPERIVILGVSLLTSSNAEYLRAHRSGDVPHRVIVIGLVLLAVSTTVSSLQRLAYASRVTGTMAAP